MKLNVLITGASGNLGKVVVNKFLEVGHHVIAIVSTEKTATQLPGKVKSYIADLRNETSVRPAFEKIIAENDRIDVAILLAGGFAMGNLTNTTLTSINEMIGINFNTAYSVAQPVFNKMVEQKYGRIILISARPAIEQRGGREMIGYALSKSLILKLAELLNAEGKDKGVITSVLIPGTIDTHANRETMPLADRTHWVTPEELTDSMLYLVSDAANSLREAVLKFYGNG